MVLQHSQPVPIWGWSISGTTVSTTFQGKYLSVKADYTGFWKIVLDPVSASLKPYDIKVTNSLFESIVLEDILFGDVFLCAGQSNMEYSVNAVPNAEAEVQNANNYPFIRLTSGPNQGDYHLRTFSPHIISLHFVNPSLLFA
jgi:sialate O-acetylesterase